MMTSVKESKRRLIEHAKEEIGMTEDANISTTTVAETANYVVWTAQEEDGEETYHIELGSATIHFFKEEWEEFVELFREIV